MILKKPLLFIYPLSPSLQKYLEFAKGSAEEEGFEIYELDILGEALQLVPTVGAALLLGSSPKKMAQILQTTRKVLQNNSSKVLLLTDKALPLKLVQKMQKIGLTEYLPEPVNPKTLIYKVGLLLKSLPTNDFNKKENDENDVLINKSEVQLTEEKQRIEKGIISDTVIEEMNIEENSSIELLIESDSKEKSQLEDLLLTSSAATDQKSEFTDLVETKSSDSDERDEKNSDESIETYYKTITEEQIKIEIDHSPSLSKVAEKESTKEEASRVRDDSLKLNLDDESATSAKDDTLFNLTPQKSVKAAAPDEVNALTAQEDDETELLLFEIEQAKKNIRSEAQEESDRAKTITEKDDSLSISKSEKNKARMDELLLDKLASPEESEEEQNQEESYKLKSIKKTSTVSELEKKKKEDSNLKLQTDEKVHSLKQDEDDRFKLEEMKLTSLELSKKEAIETEIQLKPKEQTPPEASSISLHMEESTNGNQSSLDILSLDIDSPNKSEKTTNKEESITLTDSEKLELSNGKSEDDAAVDLLLDASEHQRKQSALLIDNILEDTNSELAKAAIDDIEVRDHSDALSLTNAKLKKEKGLDLTLQSSAKEKQTKEQSEYEWSNINRQKKEIIDDRWVGRKKETVELVFEKEGRPGDEIDYRKLKKMFEHVDSIDLAKKNQRNNSMNNNSKEQDDKAGSSLFKDIFLQSGESGESESEQEIAHKTLFPSETNGVEFLVRVLQLYFDKRSDVNIMLYISNALHRRHFAYGGFFMVKKDGTSDEFFSSSHQIEYSGDRQLLIKQWEELKDSNRDVWKAKTLPSWDDETFQNKPNNFTYPFFEGIDQLGFAHFVFPDGIGQKESTQLEMMIESVRSIYLNRLKQSASAVEKEKTVESEKEKTGFFSSFFGKKKGH